MIWVQTVYKGYQWTTQVLLCYRDQVVELGNPDLQDTKDHEVREVLSVNKDKKDQLDHR